VGLHYKARFSVQYLVENILIWVKLLNYLYEIIVLITGFEYFASDAVKMTILHDFLSSLRNSAANGLCETLNPTVNIDRDE